MPTLAVRKIVVFVAFVMLFLGVFPSFAQSTNQPYEEALKSYYANEFDASVIHLKNALRNNPNHLPSRLLMAEILISQGDGTAAEIELNVASKGNADNRKILPLMLEAYLLQNKLDEVIENARRFYNNDKLSSRIAVLKGRAYFQKSSKASAKTAFNEALFLDSANIEARLGLAQIAMSNSQLEKAEEIVNKALVMASNNTKARQLLANIKHSLGELEESNAILTELILEDEGNFPALLTRASILVEQQRFDDALNDVNKILDDIPNEPRANYLKAIIVASLGRIEELNETEEHLNAVLSGMPEQVMRENPFYFYLAGLVSYNRGNLELSLEALGNYVKIVNDDLRALKLLSNVALELEEYSFAIRYLNKARLIDPEDKEVWNLLGTAYMRTEAYSKAEGYFKNVVKALPDLPIAWRQLGQLQLEMGQALSAIESTKKALSLAPDDETAKIQLMAAYQEANQLDAALGLLDTLIALYPEDSRLIQRKGILTGLKGDHANAKRYFEQASTLDENNIDAIVHLARMEIVQQNREKAIQRLTGALERFPNNVPLLVEIGDVYLTTDDVSTANRYYSDAYALDQSNALPVNRLLDVHIKENDIEKAIELAKNHVVYNNREFEIHRRLALLYMQDRNFDDATKSFQMAVKYAKNKSPVLLDFANAQIAMQDLENATSSLKKAIAWNENFYGAYLQLVKLYGQTGQINDALTLIDKLQTKVNLDALPDMLRGDVYLAVENFAEAINYYRKSLKKEPSQQATYGLSQALIAASKVTEAIDLLKTWLTENDNNLVIVIALADAYVEYSAYEQAVQLYEKQILQFGAMPILLNNLAHAYMLDNKPDKALVVAQQAYSSLPQNMAIKDTLAWAYTQNKEYEKALPLFREALAIESDNAEFMYHLAVNLVAIDRKFEAKRYLELVLASEQDFHEKPKAATLLNSL